MKSIINANVRAWHLFVLIMLVVLTRGVPVEAAATVANWLTTGNVGSGQQWLGTQNNYPLVIGTNFTERMRVYPSGNVRIGTTAPGPVLDVESNNADPASILIKNTNSGRNEVAAVDLDSTAQSPGALWRIQTGTTSSASPDDLVFTRLINGAIILTLQQSSGNVGIGTTNPHSMLQVVGNYIQYPTISGGPPPASDCASDADAGRTVVRTDGNINLYVCRGATGWVGK